MTSDSTVVPLRQPDEITDPLSAVLRSGLAEREGECCELMNHIAARNRSILVGIATGQ